MRIKGAGFKAEYAYLLKRFGIEGLEKVKAALSENDRQELFSRPILPVSWYDFQAYMNLILTADKILGQGDMALVKEAGYHCARDNFKGVYKFFISLTSPRFILNNSEKVWQQYYDRGKILVEWPGEKHCVLKITDAPDIPLHHEWDQIPTMEETLWISGGKNVRVRHLKCIAWRDPHCLVDVTWE